MEQKGQAQSSEHTDLRTFENKLIKDIKDSLVQENRRKYDLLLKTRKEFVDENTKQRKEKRQRDAQEKQGNKDFKVNFFPFTYGDPIEKKRANLK